MAEKKHKVTIGSDGTIHVDDEPARKKASAPVPAKNNTIGSDGTIHMNKRSSAKEKPKIADAKAKVASGTATSNAVKAEKRSSQPEPAHVDESPTLTGTILGLGGVACLVFVAVDAYLRSTGLSRAEIVQLNDIGELFMAIAFVFLGYYLLSSKSKYSPVARFAWSGFVYSFILLIVSKIVDSVFGFNLTEYDYVITAIAMVLALWSISSKSGKNNDGVKA